MKRFAEEVKKIEMSAEMQERIMKICYKKMEEENMKNGKGKTKLTGTKGKQKYGMDTR